MDILTLLGLIIGFGVIIVGKYLEGGNLETILNAVALLIVLGGTFGAAMLQTRIPTFKKALGMFLWVISPPKLSSHDILSKVLKWNTLARAEGLFRLESMIKKESDPFIIKGLQLVADGTEVELIREILENDLDLSEEDNIKAAKVYDAMGGYAPTMGILGAVLGLINVMTNLADPASLGSGIAVAFVATIYGVGLANLVFIPIGHKLRAIIDHQSRMKTMLIDGFTALSNGDNQRTIEIRLQSYLD